MNDVGFLVELLRDLHNTTGFRISIHDVNFNEIAGYPEFGSEFCKRIHNSEEIYRACIEEDSKRFLEVQATQKTIIYKCKFGLYEAISPIYNYNVLSGYLMMGQVGNSDDFSEKRTIDSIRPYLENNIDDLNRLIKAIPVIENEIITSSINLMTVCANYLTLTNRIKTSVDNLGELILRYLYNNYSEKIVIDDMCRKFNCCKSTLINAFRKTYNVTIMEKLTEIRIQEAKKLLKESKIPISEISQLTGFADQSYFSKIFKETTNLTPREYRNNPS